MPQILPSQRDSSGMKKQTPNAQRPTLNVICVSHRNFANVDSFVAKSAYSRRD
jgi:hypothetical protein